MWDPLSLVESQGFLTDYKLAYMDALRSSCPQIDLGTTNTTLSVDKGNTQTVISNLDPGLEYCVAIAASTVAGTSGFSDTQKVPCKCMTNHRLCLCVMISPFLLRIHSAVVSNSLFQLHLSGIHTECAEWAVSIPHCVFKGTLILGYNSPWRKHATRLATAI